MPSELNAAYLYAQLEEADKINENRINSWKLYNNLLISLKNKGVIELPFVPENCIHNAHMFYIKVKDLDERSKLIDFLKKNDILSVFHYVPLHTSIAGLKYGEFVGEDNYTTKESERLLRLPLYYGLEEDKIYYITNKIKEFFEKEKI